MTKRTDWFRSFLLANKDENLKMVDMYPPFTQTLAIGLLNLNLACLFLLNLVKGDG